MSRPSLLLLVVLAAACARADAPVDDPASAAGMTDADFAGTWTGTAMPEGSDSVIARWTQVCAAGTCRGTSEGSTDTTLATYTLSADSSMGVSSPRADADMGGAMVVERWVARVSNGQVSGTGLVALADRPDSVLMRYRFSGTRQH